jgi:gamma-glutamyltranspeptidase/glutathione hydrolase
VLQSPRVRRWLRRIAIGLGLLVCALAALAWYVKGLAWRNRCGEPIPRRAVAHARAAVATSRPLATRAAAEVLRDGGSAADAAVAAALMLAIAEPGNSGLGGGGFALVHEPGGRDLSLDFRERAPLALDVAALTAAARRDENALRNGALAVAVPAEWAGLVELHRRWGKLPLSRLLQPAIEAAQSGVEVDTDYAARCWVRVRALRADPEARATFLTSLGVCPMPGWKLRQPNAARTLAALAERPDRWDELVGRPMVAFLSSRGSPISAADLAAARPVERPVVSGSFLGHRIVSMGPPSSGGVLVIGLLQIYERARARLPNANPLHLWIEASRIVFHDRAELLGDPDYVAAPAAHLVSSDYAEAQARRVPAAARAELPAGPAPREGSHTTHLSVIDGSGLAIALTQTINVPFGSGLVVPGTGVLLNDEMDDFYLERPNAFGLVGNERNAPAPGKRPLSSMSPTFVFDEHGLQAVLGSPGGSSIPSAVAWVIRGLVEGGLSAEDAVRAPRLHHQWVPDVLEVEPRFDRAALPPAPKVKQPMFPVGRVQLLVGDSDGWRGVSDCRDEGEPWSG